MWYFSWVLGVGFAISFSIINAMWLEDREPVDRTLLAPRAAQGRTAALSFRYVPPSNPVSRTQ
jgi:cyd operon protein YbgT